MQIIAKHTCFVFVFFPSAYCCSGCKCVSNVSAFVFSWLVHMHREACVSAHTDAWIWSREAPKLLVKMGRWLADWLRRLDLGIFFLPAMGGFQPSGLKGKCKLRDKLPCVMMRHESKGWTSGTDYICASCAKKAPLVCSEFGAYGHGISLRLPWQSHGGSVSSRCSYPNCPASPAA